MECVRSKRLHSSEEICRRPGMVMMKASNLEPKKNSIDLPIMTSPQQTQFQAVEASSYFGLQLSAVHSPAFVVLLDNTKTRQLGGHYSSWVRPGYQCIFGKLGDPTRITKKVFIQFQFAIHGIRRGVKHCEYCVGKYCLYASVSYMARVYHSDLTGFRSS